MVKKRIQHSDSKVTGISVPRCESIYMLCDPNPPSVLNAVLIVLVAAAGGVVLTKVKLLAMSDWCCCHIFNLYLFKGCQSVSDILQVYLNSLHGCWQGIMLEYAAVYDPGVFINKHLVEQKTSWLAMAIRIQWDSWRLYLLPLKLIKADSIKFQTK